MFCCNCDGEVYQVNQSTTIGCFYTFPRPDWLRFSATPDWGPFEVLATTGLSKWQMKLEAALPIRVAICAILASNTPGRCRGLWVCLSPRIARLEKVPWRDWQLQDQSVHVLFLTLFSSLFSFNFFPKHCACWEEWGVFCRSFFKSWIPNAISLKASRKHSESIQK